MHYSNIEETIEFSDVKIAMNTSTLIYILSTPTTGLESCQKLILKRIKHHNVVVEIEYENILKCRDKIFGIKEICKILNKLSICNSKIL